jgi:methyl-accepting chemotaxis protein
VREINEVTSNIASAIGQQDAATREISANAQRRRATETLFREVEKFLKVCGWFSRAAPANGT